VTADSEETRLKVKEIIAKFLEILGYLSLKRKPQSLISPGVSIFSGINENL